MISLAASGLIFALAVKDTSSMPPASETLQSLLRCSGDRFGEKCTSSLLDVLEYLPAQWSSLRHPRKPPYETELSFQGWWGQDGEQPGLGSLVQQWICSLGKVSIDLGGVTIGKTLGNRALLLFANHSFKVAPQRDQCTTKML